MKEKKCLKKGSTTLEYAILMPVVFACIFAAITVLMILYQKTLIQGAAEEAAQGLSRQWGYERIELDEIKKGVFKKETYDKREIYWNLKLLSNGRKSDSAETAIYETVRNVGPLARYQGYESSEEALFLGTNGGLPVKVSYAIGLPSILKVDIKMAYSVPGAGLLKLLGFGDCLVIEGHGEALIYDAKDMINTTDYVIQMIRETTLYQKFMTKISPLKENLQKLLTE